MQPEIDYIKIGQRIKAARQEKGYSQADLGALVGCSNNHMSHVEVGQTKVSLAMLLKLAFVLEKNFDYFLLDTPYAKCDSIIDDEIAAKLKKCNVTTSQTLRTSKSSGNLMICLQQHDKEPVGNGWLTSLNKMSIFVLK